MRLLFVPQYPSRLRYQQWWYSEFPKNLEKHFDEIVVIEGNGEDSSAVASAKPEDFSPINLGIQWETRQINQYMNMKVYNDDIMFIADLSFPGFFPNVLYHKRPSKVFMFCHGTSLNHLDYFEPTRPSKLESERAFAMLSDAVFVGSNYHQNKLGWDNIIVTPLPYPPMVGFKNAKKTIDIISVSRPTKQKVDLELEYKLEESTGIKIERPTEPFKTWKDYYKFVASAKCMLITAQEETFGYQVVDAVMNNCIPLAPSKFSYRETLGGQYLYNDFDDLKKLVSAAIGGNIKKVELKCDKQMRNFYDNIAYHMKG